MECKNNPASSVGFCRLLCLTRFNTGLSDLLEQLLEGELLLPPLGQDLIYLEVHFTHVVKDDGEPVFPAANQQSVQAVERVRRTSKLMDQRTLGCGQSVCLE